MKTNDRDEGDGAVYLREDECFEDLQRGGRRIIQKSAGFRFGMDAVLLSGFARVRPGERVLDLGTGTGVIPILLEAKTQGGHFTGLEILADMADMAARSVACNGLREKIHIVRGDLREAGRLFGAASFDVVTSNPPYMDGGRGLMSPAAARAAARHEILCTFEDVARETAKVLKTGGRFYLVHRPRRLPELIETMRRYRLEPKRLRTVHPFAGKEANMVLIEAVHGGGPQLRIEAPAVIFREPGVYTDEIREIYGR